MVENNDFYMKGAAGNLRGKGIADLVRWRLDFDLSFSPIWGAPCPWWRPSPLTPITGLYVLALSQVAGARGGRGDPHRFSGLPARWTPPGWWEAGRDRARIKLNQQQKEAVDAVAPGLPTKEVTPSCSIPSIRGSGQR